MGWGEAPAGERSLRGMPRRRRNVVPARPLARYLSVGYRPPQGVCGLPPAIKRCSSGRPGGWCAGFGRFEVVLAGRSRIAEVVERRVAQTSLGVKSAGENHGSGLALPRESIGKAKQRRKPKHGGKVVRSVAGSDSS